MCHNINNKLIELYLSRGRFLHATQQVLRSYIEWTNGLRSTRFTPVEVLALARGVQYVIIDPNQEALLLPLTIKRYTALLQDLAREGSSLIVLLGPGDSRTPPPGTEVTTEGFVTGDGSTNQTSPPFGVNSKKPSLRLLVKKARLGLKGNFGLTLRSLFITSNTNRLPLKDGRVVVRSHVEVGRLATVWGLYLSQVLGHPLRYSLRGDLFRFRSRLEKIISSHGLLYGMRYLKVSLFCIHKYMSGESLSCTKEHGIAIGLSRSGLPRLLPVSWRHAIVSGNLPMIRFTCSLLTLYKAVHTPSVVASLAPVIQPHPSVSWVGFEGFCSDFYRKVGVTPLKYFLGDLLFSSKAGPSVTPAGLGWVTDALSWQIVQEGSLTDPSFAEVAGYRAGIQSPLFRFAEAFDVLPGVTALYNNLIGLRKKYTDEVMIPLSSAKSGLTKSGKKKQCSYWSGRDAPGLVGKLVFLMEAAGKIRTIAIGDCFSQTLLRPIHDFLFSILKRWSEVDGTFDQQGAVDRFRDKGFQEIFSFDLSKATDTIPHNLYLGLLGPLLGTKQAKAWLDLMVDRTFKVQKPFPSFSIKEGLSTVRYTRGQPMGMYSSWGALAVLHHLIIQYCAAQVVSRMGSQATGGWRTGPLPFNNYLVLGDDMVLACPHVASEYQKFCSSNGIELSLSKSFISGRGFFNFASQSVLGIENISPASAREFFSITSLTGRVSQLQGMVSKGFFGTKPVGFGTLLRGLYTPTAYKVVVRPALTGGVVTTPIRLGISALSSFEKFPSLKLDSPFRYPWMASISGIPSQVRSIWYNQMKPMSLGDLQLLGAAIINVVQALAMSLDKARVVQHGYESRFRVLFPSWNKETGLPDPGGSFNPALMFWEVPDHVPEVQAMAFPAASILMENLDMVLCSILEELRCDDLSEVQEVPLFNNPVKLLKAIIHDIELIQKIVKIPGVRSSSGDLYKDRLTKPWADILAPAATSSSYWGSPGWLLSKLTKEMKVISQKRTTEGSSSDAVSARTTI